MSSTNPRPRIPSYLEAFSKGLSDRDKIRGAVMDLVNAGIIERYRKIPIFGTLDVLAEFEKEINKRSDDQMKEAVKLLERRFG